MSNQIQVTTATLAKKREQLQTYNQQFNSELKDMDGLERQLTSMWKGDASDAFNKSYMQDTKRMEELHKAVDQYCKALDTIIKQYEKSEQKNASIASKRTY